MQCGADFRPRTFLTIFDSFYMFEYITKELTDESMTTSSTGQPLLCQHICLEYKNLSGVRG